MAFIFMSLVTTQMVGHLNHYMFKTKKNALLCDLRFFTIFLAKICHKRISFVENLRFSTKSVFHQAATFLAQVIFYTFEVLCKNVPITE